MGKKEKLKERLYSFPKDFTWQELTTVLSHSGYKELPSGGTSARKFVDERNHIIRVHKPHPRNIVKSYVIKEIVKALKEKDDVLKAKKEIENSSKQDKSKKKKS